MFLRTVVRDCLYVNWALPRQALPELPESLRYELHEVDGARCAMVSALLFRQTSLRLGAAPFARVSHPQCNLRFYVIDEEGVPSVLFHALMVPSWVLPLARLAGQEGLSGARFDYPRIRRDVGSSTWRWKVSHRGALVILAEPGTDAIRGGPDLGSWQKTCDHLRRRDRGYVCHQGRLRRVETSHTSTSLWPVKVEIERGELLERALHLTDGWPPVHSSWICPEMPLDFELVRSEQALLASRVPAPG